MTFEDLVNAGFIEENWPTEIPMPSEENILVEEVDSNVNSYTYKAEHDGKHYAASVDVNHSLIEDPAEGVVFMLNQFAYLFRSKPDRVLYTEGNDPYKTNFG